MRRRVVIIVRWRLSCSRDETVAVANEDAGDVDDCYDDDDE